MLNLFSAFIYFLLYISSLLNFIYYYIANFFPNCHIFIKHFFIFYHKIHTFSLIKISFIYTYFWKEYAYSLISLLPAFVTNEIFKIMFIKRKLFRYHYFINIYIVYGNRTFILIKFVFLNFSVIKFYIFFTQFYIWF